MKVIGLILLVLTGVSYTAATISREDLLNFADGYFTGLGVTANVESLHACVEDHIAVSLESAAVALKDVIWHDQASVLLGFSKLLVPVLQLIGMVQPCDDAEIEAIYQQVRSSIENHELFINKVLSNYGTLVISLTELFLHWDEKQFALAGKAIGSVINWLLLN